MLPKNYVDELLIVILSIIQAEKREVIHYGSVDM